MKTADELNAIRKEIETVNKKLAELTNEELAQVVGGINLPPFNPSPSLIKADP